MRVLVPSRLREPPLISRITTSGRILRSVRLWSALSPSTRTNWTNSSSCRSKRLTSSTRDAGSRAEARSNACARATSTTHCCSRVLSSWRGYGCAFRQRWASSSSARTSAANTNITASFVDLLQPVQIVQQMHPAALTLAGIAVVAAGAVADQTARELPIQNAPDDVLASYS